MLCNGRDHALYWEILLQDAATQHPSLLAQASLDRVSLVRGIPTDYSS